MNTDLDNKLCKKHPKIFRDRNASMTQTCMCWGFPGDGWYHIIDQLCDTIQSHINWSRQQLLWRLKSIRLAQSLLKKGPDVIKTFAEIKYAYIKDDIIRRNKEIETFCTDPYLSLVGETSDCNQDRQVVPQVIARQVKEKFGTLCFYYSGGDTYIRGVVSMAESMSAVTCERCGNPGTQTKDVWIQTLCLHCQEVKESKLDILKKL